MSIENVTPNRSYPLPYEDNELVFDVLRLIAALNAIDVDVAAVLAALTTKANATHGHVLSDTTGLVAALASKQDVDERGEANGYASLGADGKVPAAQLPAALFGAMSYQGTWNANTNSPTIPAATGTNKGWYYKVATAGSTNINGETDWKVGDWVVSNGTTWDKIDNTDQVASVAGLQGVISVSALVTALAAVTLTDAQTLTNKTLTSPTINGGAWTGGTDLAIADGGTGQSTAPNAFNALKQAASETATGVVELATAAEVATGTDTARVSSVANMKNHPGAAKAWVVFDGTGTPAIKASYNVSSITDNGTGDYTINFATAMPDANYAVALSSRILVGAGGGGTCRILAATAPTASALRFDTLNYSGTLADPVLVTATVFR